MWKCPTCEHEHPEPVAKFPLFDPERRTVYSQDGLSVLRLPPTESDILHVLLMAKGQPRSNERIFVKVWGSSSELENVNNNVSAWVSRLRKHLKNFPGAPFAVGSCGPGNHTGMYWAKILPKPSMEDQL